MKILRQLLFVSVAVVIVLLIVDRFVSAPTTVKPLDYGSFIAQLDAGKIESFHAVGLLGSGKTTAGKSYTVTIPNKDSAFVAQL